MALLRHADHDPEIVCRPAGNGLCEPMDEDRARRLRQLLDELAPGWRERAVAHLPPLEPR
jgi:hypothetical protein